MYKVFINNKVIIFTKSLEHTNSKHLLKTTGLKPKKLLQKLLEESSNTAINEHLIDLQTLEFPLQDFISLFKKKTAGGGLVVNPEGEVLMILRNGHWDLPKGHLDKGESIETCALREVQEETGIANIQLVKKLTTTYHHYELKGKNILKETHWYLMHATTEQHFTPQKQEGIEQVEWTQLHLAKQRLNASWKSLTEVLAAYTS